MTKKQIKRVVTLAQFLIETDKKFGGMSKSEKRLNSKSILVKGKRLYL